METFESSSLTFRKRKGTTDKGKDYEDLMVASLTLKLIADENIDDFKLSSNDSNFGAFDDVVLECKSQQQQHKYAMQLKHANDNKILTKSSLTGNKGNFSIQKYFEDYKNLGESIGAFKLILFTNRKLDISDKKGKEKNGEQITIQTDNGRINVKIMECVPEKLLNTNEKTGRCYQFRMDENGNIDNATKKEYKTFFDNFFLYTNQSDVYTLSDNIVKSFIDGYFCDYNIFKNYFEFINEWSMLEGTKIKLSKAFMKSVLAIRLLSPFIEPLKFDKALDDDRSKLLKKASDNFQITIFEKKHCDQIKKIWENENKPNDFKAELIGTKHQISEDTKNTIILWLNGKCPLIVNENQSISKAMNLCEKLKFIVLGSDVISSNSSSSSIFQNLTDLQNWPDLFEDILKKFKCSLGEKEEITLETLIEQNKELQEKITTNELMEMINGGFIVVEKDGRYEVVKHLIKAGTNPFSGEEPIIEACRKGRYEVVKLLIEAKVDINVADHLYGETAIHIACKLGHYDIVKLLTAEPATNLNAVNKYGERPIHLSCQIGRADIVKLLVDAKANLNTADMHGETPIHIACRKEYCEIVELLTNERTVDINATNKYGERPIHLACQLGLCNVAELLIRAGANVNFADVDGEVPIHIACRLENYEIFKLLISAPTVDVNASNYYGERPIHVASRLGFSKIAKMLINSKANINFANSVGELSLHIACRLGHYEIVKLLASEPTANINAGNMYGETPLQLAKKHEHYDIVKLLEQCGGKYY